MRVCVCMYVCMHVCVHGVGAPRVQRTTRRSAIKTYNRIKTRVMSEKRRAGCGQGMNSNVVRSWKRVLSYSRALPPLRPFYIRCKQSVPKRIRLARVVIRLRIPTLIETRIFRLGIRAEVRSELIGGPVRDTWMRLHPGLRLYRGSGYFYRVSTLCI